LVKKGILKLSELVLNNNRDFFCVFLSNAIAQKFVGLHGIHVSTLIVKIQ